MDKPKIMEDKQNQFKIDFIPKVHHYDHAAIKPIVFSAAEFITPSYHLKDFVAQNPLSAYEHLDFELATRRASAMYGVDLMPDIQYLIKALVDNKIDKNILEKSFKKYIKKNFNGIKSEQEEFFFKLLKTNIKQEKFEINNNGLISWELARDNVLEECISPDTVSDIVDGLTEKINVQLIKWSAVFYDESQAVIEMPFKASGIYRAWLHMVKYDETLELGTAAKNILEKLPFDSREALVFALKVIGIDEINWERYLSLSMSHTPGYIAYIKGLSHKKLNSFNFDISKKISLVDFMALRLVLELLHLINYCEKQKLVIEENILGTISSLIKPSLSLSKESYISNYQLIYKYQNKLLQTDSISNLIDLNYQIEEFKKLQQIILLDAWEESFRGKKINQIQSNLDKLTNTEIKQKPKAQFVFCIDTRSELMRNRLEAINDYQTFGFPGFFGLPLRFHDDNDYGNYNACPIILEPRHDMTLTSSNKNISKIILELNQILSDLKNKQSSSFVFAELAGAFLGLMIILQNTLTQVFRLIKPKLDSKLQNLKSKQYADKNILSGISLQDQILYASTSLKILGMVKDFAPQVVFCGHGSSTRNNPFAASLDCGACGGHHGVYNASVLAQILNNPKVREILKTDDIYIDPQSKFFAASHDTTIDQLTLVDPNHEASTELKSDLGAISTQLGLSKSLDWSETRPEWGLARNAMMVIGPRRITQGLDLDSRSFLQSYEPELDNDGTFLEILLTAPMLVANMINMQYFFSTNDNDVLGSFSKPYHNVVGGFGVTKGNSSDLQLGLPLQSVNISEDELYHEPLRLNVFVYADPILTQKIINKHNKLQNLIFNNWLKFHLINCNDNKIYTIDKRGYFYGINN